VTALALIRGAEPLPKPEPLRAPEPATIEIEIRPHHEVSDGGRIHVDKYDARLDGSPLVTASRTPFLDAARALVAAGHPADAVLIARRANGAEALRAQLGSAARLEIGEGLRFVRYRPPAARRPRARPYAATVPRAVPESPSPKTTPSARTARSRRAGGQP
jgi:hypothetical protein